MSKPEPFVDIHCHLVPGIDDGARNWDETLEMARMAARDGISTIIVTPHQLGGYRCNTGPLIQERTEELQKVLDEHGIPLQVLPGGDVRVDIDLVLTGIGYLATVLAVNVVMRVYLMRDLWARVIASTTVDGIEAAANVSAKGELANALGEGFADGLDVAGF